MDSDFSDYEYVPKYPKYYYSDAFKKTDNYERWVIFSCLMQASSYVKKYLSSRQEGKCIYCGKKLYDDYYYNVVHHRSYLNLCVLHSSKSSLIREAKPTFSKPDRTIPIPNCEYCKWHHLEDFNDCMDKLVILHDECHTMLHFEEQKLTSNKPIKYIKRRDEILSHNPEQKRKITKKRLTRKRVCKRCGQPMELREGKFGAFFGCTSFPDCRYTEMI